MSLADFALDYEHSLFFLRPFSKTRETLKSPRARLKARDGLDARARVHSSHEI